MQSIQTLTSKVSALLFTASLNLILLTGCSSTTQDLFADSLGVVPDYEAPQTDSTEDVHIAVNELAEQDPTARAALRREEVVPEEEKKKITPRLILQTVTPRELVTPRTTNPSDPLPAKKISIEKNAPLKLNQLYFDNRLKRYYEGEGDAQSALVKLAKASYTGNDSPQMIPALNIESPPKVSKIEKLFVRANQRVTKGALPTYTLPITLMLFGLIVGAAAFGYNREIQRIRAAEKKELARKNLSKAQFHNGSIKG